MKIIILLISSACTLIACGGGVQKDPATDSRIAALEQANKDLNSEIKNLKFQLEFRDWDRVAFIKPGDAGYSALRFDLGVITVKIADVKPYANGSKIVIKFGNLTSARINGLNAKLDWGKVDATGIPQNDSEKTREFIFNEPLSAGAWTSSEVVLEGIPPTELGFVRLREVGHRGIGLLR